LCNLRVFALRFWIGPLSDLIKEPRFLWRSYTRQSYSLDWEFECPHFLSCPSFLVLLFLKLHFLSNLHFYMKSIKLSLKFVIHKITSSYYHSNNTKLKENREMTKCPNWLVINHKHLHSILLSLQKFSKNPINHLESLGLGFRTP